VFHQSVARSAAAYLAIRREDFSSAFRYLDDARRFYQPTENMSARLLCGGLLGEVYLATGDRDQAEKVAEEHLLLAQRAGAFREQVRALRVLAGAAAPGDPVKALALAEQAIALHLDRSDPLELGRTMVLRASVRSQLGDSGAARRDLDEALGIFERVGAVPDVQMARRHQALIETPW
jgi:tetratricopeptide (TPR) repeat protein